MKIESSKIFILGKNGGEKSKDRNYPGEQKSSDRKCHRRGSCQIGKIQRGNSRGEEIALSEKSGSENAGSQQSGHQF